HFRAPHIFIAPLHSGRKELPHDLVRLHRRTASLGDDCGGCQQGTPQVRIPREGNSPRQPEVARATHNQSLDLEGHSNSELQWPWWRNYVTGSAEARTGRLQRSANRRSYQAAGVKHTVVRLRIKIRMIDHIE